MYQTSRFKPRMRICKLTQTNGKFELLKINQKARHETSREYSTPAPNRRVYRRFLGGAVGRRVGVFDWAVECAQHGTERARLLLHDFDVRLVRRRVVAKISA
jgi:hypothetical protein